MYYIYISNSQLLKLKHCFVNQHDHTYAEIEPGLYYQIEMITKINNNVYKYISDAELCY